MQSLSILFLFLLIAFGFGKKSANSAWMPSESVSLKSLWSSDWGTTVSGYRLVLAHPTSALNALLNFIVYMPFSRPFMRLDNLAISFMRRLFSWAYLLFW